MEIPIKMDDLGDTPILKNMQTVKNWIISPEKPRWK